MSFIEQPESPTINSSQMGRLGELANKQVALEKEIAEAESQTKEIKKTLRLVSEVDIPELMTEIGLAKITTIDGHEIFVKEIMTASISKDRKPKAIKWLMENDLESLVSTDVLIQFAKGDEEAVKECVELLQDNDLACMVLENVNTATVKATMKELIENGDDVPFELFGINLIKKSIIK